VFFKDTRRAEGKNSLTFYGRLFSKPEFD